MTCCIDTSAYSFLKRGHPDLVELFQTTPRLSLSAIVIGELHSGFRHGRRERANRQELQAFLSSSRVHVLDVDTTTADRYAEIVTYLRRNGRPLPSNDIWIAAHAMQYGFQLVTFDRHFTEIPQVSTILLDA